MPETGMKQKHRRQRPTSDMIMDAGNLLSEVEKSSVANSNKHVSMLLARSRSLDLLSTSTTAQTEGLMFEGSCEYKNDNDSVSNSSTHSSEERDCEQPNMYVTNSTSLITMNSADSSNANNTASSNLKDYGSSSIVTSHKKDASLLKEKLELNNNESKNSNNSSRTSNNTLSSNTADVGRANKLQRRSASLNTGGAAGFQEANLKEPIRITGYLEKRSKVLGWKKFWFVLDGRLLTYYKSKSEYESLSACCGCINLGIASSVRPIQIRGCKGYPLQILTRSQVYYLRSQEKPVLEQWLIAIQEASSSPPSSSALPSWNNISGSQYFKNSFTSQSQWSLNNSSEDIPDITVRLGNLPDAFYKKRDSGSLASQVPPIIQKYHSFASLQTPVINNIGDIRSRKIILSSSEDLRELQAEGHIKRNMMQQQSTSLLALDSSPQATELRQELTRKLSIGSSRKSNTKGNSEMDTAPVPKFLLLSGKNKLESGDDESHHYDEIGDYQGRQYENSDIESFKKNSVQRSDSLPEKESNIYEHIETVDPATVIWEPLNDGNGNSSSNVKRLPHRLSAGSNRNSLVSITELPEDVSSASPSPFKSSNLKSIPEASWKSGVEPYKNYSQTHSEDDLSSCRSESFRSLPCSEKSSKKRKGKAFSGFLSKVFGKKGKGKGGSQENLSQSMVISGPVDLRSMNVKQTPAFAEVSERKPLITKEKEVVNRSDSAQMHEVKTSPVMPGSKLTVNNTNVMDELKQKVGHITLKRTNSSSNSSLGSPSNENTKNCGKQKLTGEPRVPYVPRSNAPCSNKSAPVLIFQTQDKPMESSTDDDDVVLKDDEKEIQVASISISPDNESSSLEVETYKHQDECDGQLEVELRRPSGNESVEKFSSASVFAPPGSVRNNDPEDFKNKLAKFNRLSQSLSASFMAALTPSHASSMGRSQSYKAYRSKAHAAEVIPPLPPKKKNTPGGGSSGAISLYDVPLNNKPVTTTEHKSDEDFTEEKNIAAYIRNLTKKNSTPDIVLSGTGASTKPFFRDVMRMSDRKDLHTVLNSSDEMLDVHKSSPSLPPPRPPKPKPPAKPKSLEFDLNRNKRNSGSSASSDTVVNNSESMTPSSVASLKELFEAATTASTSPAVSNKSLDIDHLDGLSDVELSDTKTTNSPPDSPKICPFHSEGTVRNDSALSSDAKTPDSMISMSDRIVPDSLATTPETEIFLSSSNLEQGLLELESDSEPISINKLEIVIRDNDGSPGLGQKSPDNESRMDSLERSSKSVTEITYNNPQSVYQNLKYATVNTLIQEFETVEENEDEMSELYDDFPAEFYTPTPSSFSGYSPSEASNTSTNSSPNSTSSSSMMKKHARIDSIRNSGMEQLEAFLSFGSSSDECSFESCTDSFSEEALKTTKSTPASEKSLNNNNHPKAPPFHAGNISSPSGGLNNRTGAISRLGHSSAIGHLQKFFTNDVK